jgi:hypothetical protein
MKVLWANRIDGEYTLEFHPPVFAMMPKIGPLLAQVHHNLHLRYHVSPDDLSALPGSTVGSIGARISMFNGAVTIEIKPAEFTVSAQNIGTNNDLEKVLDVSRQALSAFVSVMSAESVEVKPSHARLAASLWLTGDPNFGTPEGARVKLNALAPASISSLKGPALRDYYPHFVLEDAAEKYTTEVLLQGSALDADGLFASVTVNASAGSDAIPMEAAASLIRAQLNQVLATFDARLREDNEA